MLSWYLLTVFIIFLWIEGMFIGFENPSLSVFFASGFSKQWLITQPQFSYEVELQVEWQQKFDHVYHFGQMHCP